MSEEIPRCPKCEMRDQVSRETGVAKIHARKIPLIFKREKLNGWVCASCAFYWPV